VTVTIVIVTERTLVSTVHCEYCAVTDVKYESDQESGSDTQKEKGHSLFSKVVTDAQN